MKRARPRRRLATRSVGVAAVALVVVAAAAGCGGGGGTGGGTTTSNVVKLGCHQYCLDAGGYGAGPGVPNMSKVLTSRVTVGSDGTFPIEVECTFRLACVGALNVTSGAASGPLVLACQTPAVPGSRTNWWAQSDLSVPAHATRTLGLTLSPCARGLLAAQHRLSVLVNADTLPTYREVPTAQRSQLVPVQFGQLTLVAP